MSSKPTTENPPIRLNATQESSVLHTLTVEVDASRVRRAFDRAYRDLARRVRVRGFRPGKAPRSVLERLYGATMTEEIERTLVAETLPDAIEQTGLEPVSEPAIEAETPRADADFRYSARLEVAPPIALPELSGLPAKRPRVQVTDEDVERELESLRQRNAPVVEEPEGTPAAVDHILTLDFVGRLAGQPFEGGSGRGVEFEMATGGVAPGFGEQLLGALAGEDREVRVTFPEDQGDPKLRGQEVVFQVHVAEVKRRHVPALDDEFAKDLGQFESLDELRERIRGDLAELRERAAREVLQRTLMDALMQRTPFEVPPGMVERQRDQRLGAARRRLEGAVPEEALHKQLEHWKEAWREEAEREIRERLLLEAVAQQEDLAVADAEVEARIAEMASEQGTKPGPLRKAFGPDVLDSAVRSKLVEEKALEFLRARAKIEETTDS